MRNREQELDDDVIQLADDIADYLTTREGAADTMEGLKSWWLFRQQVAVTDTKLRLAIDYLNDLGLIGKHKLPDGSILYTNNKRSNT